MRIAQSRFRSQAKLLMVVAPGKVQSRMTGFRPPWRPRRRRCAILQGAGPRSGFDQGLYIVRDQGMLVAGVKLVQLGNGSGVVDQHGGQNIFLLGSTHLGIAALTVIMGSLTTWFIRSFMATLHSR